MAKENRLPSSRVKAPATTRSAQNSSPKTKTSSRRGKTTVPRENHRFRKQFPAETDVSRDEQRRCVRLGEAFHDLLVKVDEVFGPTATDAQAEELRLFVNDLYSRIPIEFSTKRGQQ